VVLPYHKTRANENKPIELSLHALKANILLNVSKTLCSGLKVTGTTPQQACAHDKCDLTEGLQLMGVLLPSEFRTVDFMKSVSLS